MRAAIYARVSKYDQNPEIQLDELRAYAAFRGFTVVATYVDEMTGDMYRREKFKKNRGSKYNHLMEDAAKKQFDVVLVWKYDRLARSVVHLVESLRHFDKYGVAFISTTQQLDTSTAAGRMVFQILGSFAEYERAIIAERTQIGLKFARRRGVILGPHISKGVPRPPKIDADARSRMVEMFLAGVRVKDFALKEGITARHAYRILRTMVCRLDYGNASRWNRRN